MFSPEMMKQAQEMMGKMTPEQMKQMTEMASKMDPAVLRSMSSSMGGAGPSDEELRTAQQQMKNMSPEQMKSQFEASQKLANDNKNYHTRGAQVLKAEGTTLVKAMDYAGAKEKYRLAIENLASCGCNDPTLLESCRLNVALCELKLQQFTECVATCDTILAGGKPVVKALFRRGAACCQLPERLREGYVYLKRANLLSPSDGAIEIEFNKQRERAEALDLDLDAADKEAQRLNACENKITEAPASSDPTMDPAMVQNMAKMVDSMSPEHIDNMSRMTAQMRGAPVGPSPSAEEIKSRIAAQAGQAPASSSNCVPTTPLSPEAMRDAFKDGSAMKQAASMVKDFSPEQLASMTGQSKEQCEGMRDAMRQMQENPDMMNHVTKMMENLSPEDMERMMKMRGPGAPAAASGSADPNAQPPSPQDMMKDPDMVKTAETFFKSMTPEMLRDTVKSQGYDISDKQAKLATKVIPFMMALYRYFLHFKKVFAAYGRYIVAFIALIIGLYFF